MKPTNSLTPSHIKGMEQQIQELLLTKTNLENQLAAAIQERDELRRKLATANNIIDAMNEAAIDDLI